MNADMLNGEAGGESSSEGGGRRKGGRRKAWPVGLGQRDLFILS